MRHHGVDDWWKMKGVSRIVWWVRGEVVEVRGKALTGYVCMCVRMYACWCMLGRLALDCKPR